MVIDKPQKVEIQKIDSMVVLIWPGDLMLSNSEFPFLTRALCSNTIQDIAKKACCATEYEHSQISAKSM